MVSWTFPPNPYRCPSWCLYVLHLFSNPSIKVLGSDRGGGGGGEESNSMHCRLPQCFSTAPPLQVTNVPGPPHAGLKADKQAEKFQIGRQQRWVDRRDWMCRLTADENWGKQMTLTGNWRKLADSSGKSRYLIEVRLRAVCGKNRAGEFLA